MTDQEPSQTTLSHVFLPWIADPREHLGQLIHLLSAPPSSDPDREWLPNSRLSDPSPEEWEVLESLVEAVIPLLDDPHPPTQWRAAQVLSLIHAPEARSALSRACTSADPQLREFALRGLAAQGGPEAQRQLCAAVDDESQAVRATALAGLAAIDEAEASATAKIHQAWTSAPSLAVRALALRALATLEPKAATEEILDLLLGDEPPPALVEASVHALSILGEQAAPRLRAAAQDAPPPAKARVMRGLATASSLSTEELEELTRPAYPAEYRSWAAGELSARDAPRAASILNTLSNEGPTLARIDAAGARLRAGDIDALKLVLPLLWGPPSVRPAVERALAQLPEPVVRILELYAPRATANPVVGAAAIELLGRMGRSGVADAAMAATNASDDRLGAAALVACARLGVGDVSDMLDQRLAGRPAHEVVEFISRLRESAPPLPLPLVDALLHHGAVAGYLLAFEAIRAHPRPAIVDLVVRNLTFDERPEPVHRELLRTKHYREALESMFDPAFTVLAEADRHALHVRVLAAVERAPTARLACVAVTLAEVGLAELAPEVLAWRQSRDPAVQALGEFVLRATAPWRL